MISRTPTALEGVCLNCRQAVRTFSTTRSQQRFGPEHPRYIEIPEPPQQGGRSRAPIKGTLPVPRDLFSGKNGLKERRLKSVELATLDRQHTPSYQPPAANSFLGWKGRLAEQRKQNMREGVSELRRRHIISNKRRDARSELRAKERDEAVNRPMREDERLTMDSNNFDYDALMRGEVLDNDREKLIAESRERYALREAQKKEERFYNLHTLFTKATTFITTTQQLDEALETAFGTDENPVTFATDYSNMDDAHSIWALGQPISISDMMNNLSSTGSRFAPSAGQRQLALRAERITQVAETLTGGTITTE